jgi:hypothetical protein
MLDRIIPRGVNMDQVYLVRCKQLDGFKVSENGRYQRPIIEKSIPDSMIRRFHLRAGFRETCDSAIEKTRQFILDFLGEIIHDAEHWSYNSHCATFYLSHIRRACAIQNIQLYGFDDTCVLDHGKYEEEYHVTELIESQEFVFSDKIFEDEPEMEPGTYFPRTNFVENYLKRYGPRGDWEDPEEESEWSDFYASDEDDGSEWSGVEDDDEEESEEVSPEYKLTLYQQNYIKSLDAAQNVVDENLLFNGTPIAEEDAPLGQGYYSDCDDDETKVADWMHECEYEDTMWQQDPKSGIYYISEENAIKLLKQEIAHEVPYVIGRQAFYRWVRTSIQDLMADITITSVALSALHNAFEQHLHRALTTGSLKAEILLSIVQQKQSVESHLDEEVEAHILSLEHELFEEQTKRHRKEEQICQLQKSYQAKELEMERQIKVMQERIYHLQEYQQFKNHQPYQPPPPPRPSSSSSHHHHHYNDENIHNKVSPNKRKEAFYHDVLTAEESNNTPAITGTIMGTLKSGLQMFMSKTKKARINPAS